METYGNNRGKHMRRDQLEPSVRPAVYTDVAKAAELPRYRKKKHRPAKNVFLFLAAFLAGLAIIVGAAGLAYIQVRNIDVRNTTPIEIAQDFYRTIYAQATGQDYTSIYNTRATSEHNAASTNPAIQSVSDTHASSEELTGSSSAQSDNATADVLTPTPLVAEFDGVPIHSPIVSNKITGILFHQASYEYAVVLSTQLREADPEKVAKARKMVIPDNQPIGNEYLDAEALHIWRPELTQMDTAIDIGAEPGTDTLAPTSGTVVLVREYDLFDTIKDFEVHIQPENRPDLDLVVIHIIDVCVKAGDKVEGGVTPIARVRDIVGEGVWDVQLGSFIDDYSGDHCHVQINDTNYPEYKEKRLKGAYVVPKET